MERGEIRIHIDLRIYLYIYIPLYRYIFTVENRKGSSSSHLENPMETYNRPAVDGEMWGGFHENSQNRYTFAVQKSRNAAF